MFAIVLFFLYLVAVFFAIGLSFGPLLARLELGRSFTALSCLGLTAVSVFVTLGYKIGITVTSLSWLVNVGAVLCLVFAAVQWIREKNLRMIQPDWSLGIRLLAAVLILAPALAGGLRFAIFQGNHIDSYNYLECALTYQRVTYQTAIGSTDQQFLDAGLFPIARDTLSARPEICLLYGTLVNTFLGRGIIVHYGFLAYFQFLSFCVLSLLARELVPGKPLLAQLLGLAIVGGFWGQYIVDINAWSQAAAMPLLLFGCLLLVRMFSGRDRWSTEGNTRSDQPPLTAAEILAFALNCVGGFYLYPEGAIFFFPAYGVVLLLGVYKLRPRIPVFACGSVLIFSAALVVLVKENNLNFLTSQVNTALRSDVNWWRYFQAFLFGNDGINKDFFSNLVDGLAGLFGCYLITPGSGYHGPILLIYRIFLLAVFLIVVVGSILGFRTLTRPARNIILQLVLVMLCETIVFLSFRQYWTAGKTLSYFAYLLLLVVLTPALNVDIPCTRFRFAAARIAWIILAGQVAFAAYRPLAASLPYGIHYSRPYPASQIDDLKKDIDFSDLRFLRQIKKRDLVIIEVSDAWIQVFLKLLLLSKSIDFCVAPPVFRTAEPQKIAEVAQPCTAGTCRLFLTPKNYNGYRQEVQIER